MHKVYYLRWYYIGFAEGTLASSAHVSLTWVATIRSSRRFAFTRRFGTF